MINEKVLFVGWTADFDNVFIKNLKEMDHQLTFTFPSWFVRFSNILKKIGFEKTSIYLKTLYFDFWISRKEVNLNEYIILFRDCLLHIDLFKHFKQNHKGLVFRNIITPSYKKHFLPLDCKKFSFEKHDCVKYGLIYIEQFFIQDSIEKFHNRIEYDFYFLGLNKGRICKLQNLEFLLFKFDFITKFLIKDIPVTFTEKLIALLKIQERFNKIPYKQNIDYISRSKCLIEFIQSGQEGLTLRVLESLFYRKKLITDNLKIRELKFYHPNNILIVDDLNHISSASLNHFLKQPYISCDEYILEHSPSFAIRKIVKNITVEKVE